MARGCQPCLDYLGPMPSVSDSCIMCTVYLHLYCGGWRGEDGSCTRVLSRWCNIDRCTPYGPVQTVLKGHGMPWAISFLPDPKNSGSHPHPPTIPVLSSDTTTERWWSAGPQLPNISRTCGTASTFVPLWIEVWRRVQVQAYLGGFKYVFLSPAWNCYITINPHHEHPWNEFENHKELIENPAFEFGSFVLHRSLSIPYVPITSVDLGACKY